MREPKKVRTRSELIKSCHGLRLHNQTLKDRIKELEAIVRDSLASFRCTQAVSDYPIDDWPVRAVAALKERGDE